MRKLLFFIAVCFFAAWNLPGQTPDTTPHQLFMDYQKAYDLGEFDRAESLLRRILEGDYDLTDYNRALVQNSLGLICYETGRFDRALVHYRRADSLCTLKNRLSVHLKISIRNNFGLYYGWLGEYTLARDHYRRALYLLDSLGIKDSMYYDKLSMIQFNHGVNLWNLGLRQEALAALKKSAKIKKAHGHAYLGSVYFNLARLYRELNEPDRAEYYFRQSISRWTGEYDASHFQLGNVYLHYGRLLGELGRRDTSLHLLLRALQVYKDNYGRRHPLTADCHAQIAAHFRDGNNLPAALEHLQQALISATGDFTGTDPGENPSTDDALHDLTLLKILDAKTETLEALAAAHEALNTNRLAIELFNRIRGSFLSGESRTYLASKQKDLFTTGIRLNLRLHELTGIDSFKQEAFLVAARAKSNELMYEMRTRELLYLETMPDTLARSILSSKQKVERYANLIQSENRKIDPDTSQLHAWQDQLFRYRDSFNRQMERLREEYPQFGHFHRAQQELTLERIRAGLRRRATLVEYHLPEMGTGNSPDLYAFVVTGNRCHVSHLQVDSAFYGDLDVLMEEVHRFNPIALSMEGYRRIKEALHRIYLQTVQPLEPYFRGKDLVIVPDDRLAYVPFDALITRNDPDSILNYPGLPYLLHTYTISYAHSAGFLENSAKLRLGFPSVNAWAPVYNRAGLVGMERLEGAAEEVGKVLQVVDGKKIPEDTGMPGFKTFLQEDRILHLAMHAVAFEEERGSPYFVIDPATDSSTAGRLHDYEVSALSLNSPMVVLSSCETAGGYLQTGEGIMSLSRSFRQAGATSVVHALWPLADSKASGIMEGYYRNLKKGIGKSRSLTLAKQAYLSTNSPTYTHPYYWAAYQLNGNDASLVVERKSLAGAGILIVLLVAGYPVIRRSFFSRA